MRKAMEQTMRMTMAVAAGTLLLTGCMAGPELVTQNASLEDGSAAEVPTAIWRRVEACAGPEVHEALGLAAVEGEPALAALVDLDGAVRCIDARVTLEEDGLVDLSLVDIESARVTRQSDHSQDEPVLDGMHIMETTAPSLLGGAVQRDSSQSEGQQAGGRTLPEIPSLWQTNAAAGDPVPQPM